MSYYEVRSCHYTKAWLQTTDSKGKNTFKALDKTPEISFVPTPEDIRDNYQYFTEANMQKLKSIGYNKPFHTLEEGVEDYVKNYLVGGKYY